MDTVLEKVCKNLGVEIAEYSVDDDPTKQAFIGREWTIQMDWVKDVEKRQTEKLKEYRESTRKRKSGGGSSCVDKKEEEEVVVDDKKLSRPL